MCGVCGDFRYLSICAFWAMDLGFQIRNSFGEFCWHGLAMEYKLYIGHLQPIAAIPSSYVSMGGR